MFAKLSKVHQCFPNVSSQTIHSLSSPGCINVYHGGGGGRWGGGGAGGQEEGMPIFLDANFSFGKEG